MANDPSSQFNISKLLQLDVGGYDISFTNSSLFMVATVAASAAFLIFTTSGRGLIPTRLQSISEMLYEFVAGLLRDSAGSEGMKFFPIVFSLFTFILVANLLGMFPYFFTVTSHIIVTAALAFGVIGMVIVYGFYKNGLGFLKLFVPSGVPGVLIPVVVLIEVISFLSRPISLSVRLFANVLAGHITLKVFAGFVVSLIGPRRRYRCDLAVGFCRGFDRTGISSCFPTSLCLRDFDLYVYQRRNSPISLRDIHH